MSNYPSKPKSLRTLRTTPQVQVPSVHRECREWHIDTTAWKSSLSGVGLSSSNASRSDCQSPYGVPLSAVPKSAPLLGEFESTRLADENMPPLPEMPSSAHVQPPKPKRVWSSFLKKKEKQEKTQDKPPKTPDGNVLRKKRPVDSDNYSASEKITYVDTREPSQTHTEDQAVWPKIIPEPLKSFNIHPHPHLRQWDAPDPTTEAASARSVFASQTTASIVATPEEEEEEEESVIFILPDLSDLGNIKLFHVPAKHYTEDVTRTLAEPDDFYSSVRGMYDYPFPMPVTPTGMDLNLVDNVSERSVSITSARSGKPVMPAPTRALPPPPPPTPKSAPGTSKLPKIRERAHTHIGSGNTLGLGPISEISDVGLDL